MHKQESSEEKQIKEWEAHAHKYTQLDKITKDNIKYIYKISL